MDRPNTRLYVYNAVVGLCEVGRAGGFTVAEIARVVGMPTSTVRYHVKKMVWAGVLEEYACDGRGNVPVIYKYEVSRG